MFKIEEIKNLEIVNSQSVKEAVEMLTENDIYNVDGESVFRQKEEITLLQGGTRIGFEVYDCNANSDEMEEAMVFAEFDPTESLMLVKKIIIEESIFDNKTIEVKKVMFIYTPKKIITENHLNLNQAIAFEDSLELNYIAATPLEIINEVKKFIFERKMFFYISDDYCDGFCITDVWGENMYVCYKRKKII